MIGAWTTASLRQSAVLNPVPQSDKSVASVRPSSNPTGASIEGGAWSQVSRLGMPLVNELIIGLPDKDRCNASAPKNDGQFADYVTNPSLPVLLQALFGSAGVVAPECLSAHGSGGGVPDRRQGTEPARERHAGRGAAAEHRAPPVVPFASQKDLGVLAGDNAGFPNGRRPIDDVVDIELRVAMGVLLAPFDGSSTRPGSGLGCVASAALHRRCRAEPGQLPAGVPLPEHGAGRFTHQRQRLRSPSMKTKLAVLSALGVAATLVTACGGHDDQAPP